MDSETLPISIVHRATESSHSEAVSYMGVEGSGERGCTVCTMTPSLCDKLLTVKSACRASKLCGMLASSRKLDREPPTELRCILHSCAPIVFELGTRTWSFALA